MEYAAKAHAKALMMILTTMQCGKYGKQRDLLHEAAMAIIDGDTALGILDNLRAEMTGPCRVEFLGEKRDWPEELLKPGNKYPWHELAEVGDRFFITAHSKEDRLKIQSSISSGANIRFGKGSVKTKTTNAGVFCTRIK